MTVATPLVTVTGQWQQCHDERWLPALRVYSAIEERPSNRCGESITGVRRIHSPEARVLQDQTPMAAQAAVGVSVFGKGYPPHDFLALTPVSDNTDS